MAHTYAIAALNPKSIVFFVAFLTQFMNSAEPALRQMLACEATFLVRAVVNAALYAMLASMARNSIHKSSVPRTVNRVGGY